MQRKIMDAIDIRRALTRLMYEIIEQNKGTENLVFIGIKTRGIYLAQRLAKQLQKLESIKIPVGSLDITLYRDDHPKTGVSSRAKLKSANIPVSIDNKHVILIDDVLFNGRTARAGLDALIDHGRPAKVSLAVLIDRGHRKFPIRPDFIGKNVPTSLEERVHVAIKEFDGYDKVSIEKIEGK